jgi:hypothetical protein
VFVYDGPNSDAPNQRLLRASGSTTPTSVLRPTGSSFFIYFSSDYAMQGTGFQVSVCPSALVGTADACVPVQAAGATCTSDAQCPVTACRGGRCCNTEVPGLCATCSAQGICTSCASGAILSSLGQCQKAAGAFCSCDGVRTWHKV